MHKFQTHSSGSRILIVDDDPGTLGVVEAMLTSSGYQVACASGGEEALQILEEEGYDSFQVVLTDYYMPKMTGLEFLSIVFEREPNLSSILMTAEGDMELVTGALKHGAVDYIDKPFRLAEILSALDKALSTTIERRYLTGAVKEIQEINLIQEVLASGDLSESQRNVEFPEVRTVFHPLKETGGDFINCINLCDKRMCLAGADVSGHDLKAGFISAYFQGIARGMLEMKADLQKVRDYFNEFLLNEWNPRLESNANTEHMTSLAVCMLLFDLQERKIKHINNGFPLPLLLDDEGIIVKLGKGSESLGWFKTLNNKEVEHELPVSGSCMLWSDGLEDQAAMLGVSSCALASRLMESNLADRVSLVSDRKDDLLLVEVVWGESDHRLPIFMKTYSGDLGDAIDLAQSDWEFNLRYVIQSIPKERLNEIMICTREALLNAVIHGCAEDASDSAYVHISCSKDLTQVFVRVDDEGDGYSEDVKENNFDEFGHSSLGLKVIECYANEMKVLNNGSTISMSFTLS